MSKTTVEIVKKIFSARGSLAADPVFETYVIGGGIFFFVVVVLGLLMCIFFFFNRLDGVRSAIITFTDAKDAEKAADDLDE